jgi:hypothetical protein
LEINAANKSLKAAHIRSLDSFSRRMLCILRAALRCPLARRYAPSEKCFLQFVPIEKV